MKLVKSCPEIVITGGPCSGKTTGMAYLKQELEDMGFMVFIIPEVATMYLPSIMNYGEMSIRDPKTYFEIQKLIVNTQMSLRHHFHNLAPYFQTGKGLFYPTGELWTKWHIHQKDSIKNS
jgi:hypothetical protein